MAGMDQEELVKSLEQMQKRLGEVALEGSGPAADALKRYGLVARKLADMGPDKSLGAIVKMMEGIGNAAERAKVATDLLASRASVWFRWSLAARRGSSRWGTKPCRRFARSTRSARETGAADDAIDRMSMAITGVGNSIMVELAPYITYVADGITEWIKLSGGFSAINAR